MLFRKAWIHQFSLQIWASVWQSVLEKENSEFKPALGRIDWTRTLPLKKTAFTVAKKKKKNRKKKKKKKRYLELSAMFFDCLSLSMKLIQKSYFDFSQPLRFLIRWTPRQKNKKTKPKTKQNKHQQKKSFNDAKCSVILYYILLIEMLSSSKKIFLFLLLDPLKTACFGSDNHRISIYLSQFFHIFLSFFLSFFLSTHIFTHVSHTHAHTYT